MKLSLFTDTLVDVNGVSRFIRDVAGQAVERGRDLEVVTSTRRDLPLGPGKFINVRPVFSMPMPKYPQIDFVIPSYAAVKKYIAQRRPDAVHISTPGPVGVAAWMATRKLGVPLVGVYHTDFPAYIDHLFAESAMTRATSWFMRKFYLRFSSVFTRSAEYIGSLERLGIPRERMVRLMPGLRTARFNTGFRDMGVWDRLEAEGHAGLASPGVRVVYVGRVSLEKNLPMLSAVWSRVSAQCATRGLRAKLIIVGDGPYLKPMSSELRGTGVYFLGFRYGDVLSTIYASSDLFVFPSVTDTLGQVVMEAQSSGIGVLVTDQGGPKEVVRDGVCGRVLAAASVDLWAKTIVGLIADDAARRSMGAAAAREMQGYDISRSFEHFWKVHEGAVRERRAGGSCAVAAV